jgi:hypothetical protein
VDENELPADAPVESTNNAITSRIKISPDLIMVDSNGMSATCGSRWPSSESKKPEIPG